MLNIQPIERRDISSGDLLDVHSVFHTIQGEGPFSGRAATFIRLAGCQLQCSNCDTDYTTGRSQQTVRSLLDQVIHPLVVITGGEPFRQNLYPLVKDLLHYSYTVQIETNGVLPPMVHEFANLCSQGFSNQDCFIVVSPKTNKVHPRIAELAAAYKYVISDGDVAIDGLPTHVLGNNIGGKCVARPAPFFNGPIYVQPADMQDEELNERNRQACIKSVMKNSDYTLQLQIHKILNLP